jgi:hypothetical protein
MFVRRDELTGWFHNAESIKAHVRSAGQDRERGHDPCGGASDVSQAPADDWRSDEVSTSQHRAIAAPLGKSLKISGASREWLGVPK